MPLSRVLDQSSDAGSSLVLVFRADQRPLVPYHDETFGNLMLHDCADAACNTGTRRLLDSQGDVGCPVSFAGHGVNFFAEVIADKALTGAMVPGFSQFRHYISGSSTPDR